VSVVIPTLGRPELDRAISSALSQPIPVEIVVAWDAAIAGPTAHDGDARVRHVSTGGGRGGAAARQLGTESASMPWVAYLDDDDWWEPTKLPAQLRLVREAAGPVVATCRSYFHRGDEASVVPARVLGDRERIGDYLVTRDRLRYGRNVIQSSSLLLARELALASGWNTDLAKHQDWDFVARLVHDHGASVVWCDEVAAHVEQGSPGSISRRSSWPTSLAWLRSIGPVTGARAHNDFVLIFVIGLPHAAAVVVAAAAAARRGRRR
jgi:glycosyltransferase involved in cell wall biosynthesis